VENQSRAVLTARPYNRSQPPVKGCCFGKKSFSDLGKRTGRRKAGPTPTRGDVSNGITLERAGTRLRGRQTKRGSPRSHGTASSPAPGAHGAVLPLCQPPGSPNPLNSAVRDPPKAKPPRQNPPKFGFATRRRTGESPRAAAAAPSSREGWGQRGDLAASEVSHAEPTVSHRESLPHSTCSPGNFQRP